MMPVTAAGTGSVGTAAPGRAGAGARVAPQATRHNAAATDHAATTLRIAAVFRVSGMRPTVPRMVVRRKRDADVGRTSGRDAGGHTRWSCVLLLSYRRREP